MWPRGTRVRLKNTPREGKILAGIKAQDVIDEVMKQNPEMSILDVKRRMVDLGYDMEDITYLVMWDDDGNGFGFEKSSALEPIGPVLTPEQRKENQSLWDELEKLNDEE